MTQRGKGSLPRQIRTIVETGYPVFPQRQSRKAYVKWARYRDNPPSLRQIGVWYRKYPDALWAVATGSETGLLILDFDGPDGVRTMARLGLQPFVRSSSGGRHVWVEAPDFPIQSGTRVDEERFPGLDVKSQGGCATFHGQRGDNRYGIFKSRKIYRWEELPAELRRMLEERAKAPSAEPVEIPEDFDKFAPTNVLLREALKRSRPGNRNDIGFWLACQLRDERYSEDEAFATLQQYANKVTNDSNPYTFQEAYDTVISAFQEPARTPRGLRKVEGKGPGLEITNDAEMADWLQQELGRGRLAGLFRRGNSLVYTPREGEEGYVPLTKQERDYDGLAQIRPIKHGDHLAAVIYYEYTCYEVGHDMTRKKALFPPQSARTVYHTIDKQPNLRWLHGVIHTPIVREDGTVLDEPGYDEQTGLFYLPNPEFTVPKIPDKPTRRQVKEALSLLQEMVDGFPFVTEHDEANFYGALITPALRNITPPPWKLVVYDAHMKRSGKSLLAWIPRTIYGGVFRVELPDNGTELTKQITAILGVTTGSVVIFDNVTGTVRSSVLAGLLTSDVHADRTLGTTKEFPTFPNDRLWGLTSNNAKVGGDLPERSIKITINPDQPRPELRTNFKIPRLKSWVKERRGELIAAIITLIRAWVVAGRPTEELDRSDDYADWICVVRGILAHAGVQGTFDHAETAVPGGGVDDEEWFDFLSAVAKTFGPDISDETTSAAGETWKAKELLEKVAVHSSSKLKLGDESGIPVDALPDDLEHKVRQDGATASTKSLGKWLANRDGWYVGEDETGYFAVEFAGKKDNIKIWRVTWKKR